jgi:5-methylcytosine-specific restriction protein A
VILFKTDAKHMFGVRKYARHATDAVPRELVPGETILLQVTVLSARSAAPKIKYVMTFVKSYPDETGESDRIWGRHWRYIVEGVDLYELKRPVDMRQVNESGTNYRRGAVKYVYVHPKDEQAILASGRLEPR